jgi:hypothetical protein
MIKVAAMTAKTFRCFRHMSISALNFLAAANLALLTVGNDG